MKALKNIISIAQSFWRKHFINECRHPPQCFECNHGDCLGCETKGGNYDVKISARESINRREKVRIGESSRPVIMPGGNLGGNYGRN